MNQLEQDQSKGKSEEAPLLEKKLDRGDAVVQQLQLLEKPFKETRLIEVAKLMAGLVWESFAVVFAIVGGQGFNLLGIALMNYDSDIHAQAGYGVAITFYLLFYLGFMLPLNDKMGVEFGRAFGAKNYAKVKQVFCQSILTALVLYFCITVPIFANGKRLLMLTGVAEKTAEKAQIILNMQMIVCFMLNILFPAQTICFSQGAESVFAFKNLISFIVSAACSCVLVLHYKMGIYGWMIGKVLYEILNFTAAVTTLIKKAHPETWGLVDFATVKEGYGSFLCDSLQFAFSSYTQFLGAESAYFFIYRTKRVTDVAAFVSIVNLSSIAYCLSLGLEVICRTRLNLLIAKGHPRMAKTFFSYYLITILLYGMVFSALLILSTPLLKNILASSTPALTVSFGELLKLYYFQTVFEIITMTVAVALKSLRRVHILIFFNLCLVVLLNLLAGYWISNVRKMAIWYNVLVMVVVNYFVTAVLVSLLFSLDWVKVVAGEVNLAKEGGNKIEQKVTTNDASTNQIHQ